jgi:integrase
MSRRRSSGDPGIYRRKDGRYAVSVELPRGADGKRKRKTFYGDTRKAVQEELRKAQHDLASGIVVPPKDETVREFLERWLVFIQDKVRPTTYERYYNICWKQIIPHIGKIVLTRLRSTHVEAMQTALRKELNEHGEPKYAPATIRHVRRILVTALNQAIAWEELTKNPAKSAKTAPVPNKEYVTLNDEQATIFLHAIVGHKFELPYKLCLLMGLRRGEALGIRWKDIDFDKQTLTVRGNLQRVNKKRTIVATKPNRIHTTPLPPSLVTALQEHWTKQQQIRAAQGMKWKEQGLVFTTSLGTPLEATEMWKLFKNVLKENNLPDMRLHDLRHSAASLLISEGIHPRVVMQILRHANISITMQLYSHIDIDPQRDAINRLDKRIGS